MENKPTLKIDDLGTKRWYKDGKPHREDGPAVEYTDGRKDWFINGKRHRLDGPAVEKPDGSYVWYLDGKLHREDGPAISDGSKEWWYEGKRHRLDGPAIFDSNGKLYWFINDINVTKKIKSWANESDIDLTNLNEANKNMIKLIWADYGK